LGFFARLRNKFSKKSSFLIAFKKILAKYNVKIEEAAQDTSVDQEIWKNICKGNYLPTKNLIFTLALTLHLAKEDVEMLLYYCSYCFDYTSVKDVIVAYLLEQKVFNPLMMEAALKEYKVENLFFKEDTQA
jgi:hypothetical protein